MKVYNFVLTFSDGRKQRRQVNVDPKQWTFDEIVNDLKQMPQVVAIDLIIMNPSIDDSRLSH